MRIEPIYFAFEESAKAVNFVNSQPLKSIA